MTIHLLTAVFGGVSSLILLFVTMLYSPGWVDRGRWQLVNVLAFVTSTVSSIFTSAMLPSGDVTHWLTAVAGGVSVGTTVFVTTQCAYTDFTYRKGDRWTLRAAIAMNAATGGVSLFLEPARTQGERWLFVLLVLLSLVMVRIPSLGKSDARATLLSVLAVYPMVGVLGVQWGLIVLALVLGVYGVSSSVRMMWGVKGTLRGVFREKMSIPMVPLITGSFLIAEICAALAQR